MKFLFDRIVSFIGLVLLSPVLLITAIIIKLKMPDGPVLFRQVRIGKDAKPFTMYKFRTMTTDHFGSSVSVANENRITPLGRVLRKFKLDELPEIWNVLKGDMSFVGPRPDVLEYIERLSDSEKIILRMRPGITSPASIRYKNEEEILSEQQNPINYYNEIIFPDKVRLNLNYLKYHSFCSDIKIISYTILGLNLKEEYYN